MDFVCVRCGKHYSCPFGIQNEKICADCEEEECKFGCCLSCTMDIVPLPPYLAAERPFTSAGL